MGNWKRETGQRDGKAVPAMPLILTFALDPTTRKPVVPEHPVFISISTDLKLSRPDLGLQIYN